MPFRAWRVVNSKSVITPRVRIDYTVFEMLVYNYLFDNFALVSEISLRTADKISVLFSINPGAPCYVAQVYDVGYGCQKISKRQKIAKKWFVVIIKG